MQEVALAEDQDRVEDCPEIIEEGEADRETVGEIVNPGTVSPASSFK